MPILLGFLLVLIAGFFQGSFVLPMTLTKRWKWEHTWAAFSLFGMLVFNWILTFLFIPNIFSIYSSVPARDIVILILFGAGWGVGAVLFGLAMDRLGMALGYPIIMGLIASLGALIPLIVFFPESLLAARGLVLIAGTALVILGIVLCSVAGSRKEPAAESGAASSGSFAAGLTVAILAGVLSCFPNVGMAFGANVIEQAKAAGVPDTFAGNAVWALFFTTGFIVNFCYCLFLIVSRRSFKDYFVPEKTGNLGLSALMAVMWIGSFYLYGMSAVKLGQWGVVVGWPLFITLSILVGNLWGLWRGEWKGAPRFARSLLNRGLILLLVAVIIVAVSNAL
ncbi:MAG TPA: L-rhamnose/proton symporter RhaT [archaeon]|nr:L-rhamnose/proton symporter RhaT [archaeon]